MLNDLFFFCSYIFATVIIGRFWLVKYILFDISYYAVAQANMKNRYHFLLYRITLLKTDCSGKMRINVCIYIYNI